MSSSSTMGANERASGASTIIRWLSGRGESAMLPVVDREKAKPGHGAARGLAGRTSLR
jgi:hypothetical protein